MDKERIAELREWLADTDLAIRGLLRHQYLLIWQERKCIADLLLLLDECEKTRAGDKETDPFLANLYGIKSRGSSNVGIEHQPDGPGSSPGPRSPAPPGQVEERREMLDAIDDAILTWAAEEGYYRPEDKKPWQKIRALILQPKATVTKKADTEKLRMFLQMAHTFIDPDSALPELCGYLRDIGVVVTEGEGK